MRNEKSKCSLFTVLNLFQACTVHPSHHSTCRMGYPIDILLVYLARISSHNVVERSAEEPIPLMTFSSSKTSGSWSFSAFDVYVSHTVIFLFSKTAGSWFCSAIQYNRVPRKFSGWVGLLTEGRSVQRSCWRHKMIPQREKSSLWRLRLEDQWSRVMK